MTITNEYYRQEIEQIDKQLEVTRRLDSVNAALQKYNWIFLHPYSQGMDIGILQRYATEAPDPGDRIFTFFAQKFLDLRTTTHFIEGFYNTRPFLKDYVPAIRESVVLCLQKDFRGAISIVLPVIEGTLRKCLIDSRGQHKKAEFNISELLTAFDTMSKQYVDGQRIYLTKKYAHLQAKGEYFDQNQEDQILEKHKEYFDLWIGQVTNYLKNNLYLDTRKNVVKDNLNRHVIFHALQDDIDFSFRNYLRLFNCINFLSWSIGLVTEGCSVLSEANEEEVFAIWNNYLRILMVSEAMTETKASIYGKPIESFERFLHPKYHEPIRLPADQLKILLQTMTVNTHRPQIPTYKATPSTNKIVSIIKFIFGRQK